MHTVRRLRTSRITAVILGAFLTMCGVAGYRLLAQGSATLGAPFQRQILKAALPESPFDLRFFSTAVKTGADGRIVRDVKAPGPSRLVGAEAAGDRAGLPRFTKILFANDYSNGTPGDGDRIDPNNPIVKSGNQHWPFVKQPFRSWPNSVALTPDGRKLYVTLPGREGYPDWRVASVDTTARRVLRWINLSVAGQPRGTRPMGIAISSNPAIYPRPYAVVTNQYANFASIIDTGTDAVIGTFEIVLIVMWAVSLIGVPLAVLVGLWIWQRGKRAPQPKAPATDTRR